MYRINIVLYPQQKKNEPPKLNMANGNAVQIFEGILNFPRDEWGFSMDAWQLLSRIDKIIDPQLEEFTTEDSEEVGEQGAKVYHQGKDITYFKYRLEQIREIAQWAINNGYQKIYVG